MPSPYIRQVNKTNGVTDMTLFEINISSLPAWPNMAEASVDAAGIMRWTSNNRVPPAECVEQAVREGHPVNVAACATVRDAETSSFLAEYRLSERYRPISTEEAYEMRAAFGPGIEVVNVITGRRHRT